MRAVYVDTSILLKYYIEERETKEVRKAFSDRNTAVYTSEFTYIETLAYVARQRARNKLDAGAASGLVNALRQDVCRAGKFGLIRHGRGTMELIEGFAASGQALRTVDLIHLSAALYLSKHRPDAREVLTGDMRLGVAAERQGLVWVRI